MLSVNSNCIVFIAFIQDFLDGISFTIGGHLRSFWLEVVI